MGLFKKYPATKKLEDFEQIDINLIEGTPFEYGYVMRTNDRVIQKATYEDLINALDENAAAMRYIKMGPERDFELFGSKGLHKKRLLELKLKGQKASLKYILFYSAVMVFTFFYFDHEKINNRDAILLSSLFVFMIGLSLWRIFKYSKQLKTPALFEV